MSNVSGDVGENPYQYLIGFAVVRTKLRITMNKIRLEGINFLQRVSTTHG